MVVGCHVMRRLPHPSIRRNSRRIDSIYHLVGAHHQRYRHVDTEGLCGGEIDDEFKSAWQQYWQVGWVSAFKNMSSVNTQLAISLGQAAAIAHETASSDKLASRIHYGNRIAFCQSDKMVDDAVVKGIGLDRERTRTLLRDLR